jgi:hypothetical protein
MALGLHFLHCFLGISEDLVFRLHDFASEFILQSFVDEFNCLDLLSKSKFALVNSVFQMGPTS